MKNLTRRQARQVRRRRSQVQTIADRLIGELKARGIVVHRTDAVNSASAYLKLDYGILGSVRISDHLGTGEVLGFRWNLMSEIGEPYTTTDLEQGHDRHWYGWVHLGDMIGHIERYRAQRQQQMGQEGYVVAMGRNEWNINRTRKGFWEKARRV